MGGPGNPPDRPYIVQTLPDDDDQATVQLQAARDAGYELLFAVPHQRVDAGVVVTSTRVILGNYKDKQ